VQLERQQRLVDRFRLFSPAIVAQDALNDVAGTGAARYRHFVSLVKDYHAKWRALFAGMIVRKDRLSPASYDGFPRFMYQEEALGDVVRRAGTGGAILAAIALVLGALGIRRLRRYPVAD
jgi:ABC-2 type transport system permease protein